MAANSAHGKILIVGRASGAKCGGGVNAIIGTYKLDVYTMSGAKLL